MKPKLVEQMQSYVAETCVGASALRNQGGSGLVQVARGYFKNLDLSTVPTKATGFNTWLDLHTEKLCVRFTNEARKFGAARKALNLFLRSSTYNCCLNRAFGLDSVLPLLEVPLDSYVANHLMKLNSKIALKWVSLKSVTSTDHGKYQAAALTLAEQWQVHRVDLDVFFYRNKAGTA